LDEILRFTFGKIYVKIDIEGIETAILKSSKHLEKINELAIEAHNNNKILTRILSQKSFSIYINKYKINITLSRVWLKISPKWYGIILSVYRLIVSTIVKPEVTIVKAKRH